MAKKSHKSASSAKYKSFQLDGNHTSQKVLVYIVLDLSIGFVLGYLLQPTIAATLTSYAAGH